MVPASARLTLRVATALAVTAALLAATPSSIAAWLEFNRGALEAGQLWRLWTAHLVHFSPWHAAIDIAVLFIIATLAEQMVGSRRVLIAAGAGAPVIALGLYLLVPEMTVYRGSSALSYLLGTLLAVAWWRLQARLRPLIALAVLGVGVKLLLDVLAPAAATISLPEGIRVAWQAHLLAVMLALIGSVIYCRHDRRHSN